MRLQKFLPHPTGHHSASSSVNTGAGNIKTISQTNMQSALNPLIQDSVYFAPGCSFNSTGSSCLASHLNPPFTLARYGQAGRGQLRAPARTPSTRLTTTGNIVARDAGKLSSTVECSPKVDD